MNEVTSSQNELTDVDNLYRRVTALDSRRPGEWVRRKVQAYAAQQAAERTLRESSKAREGSSSVAPPPPALKPTLAAARPAPAAKVAPPSASKSWLVPAILGGVAVVAIVGFLVVPSLMPRHTTPSTALVPPPIPVPEETVRETARAPAVSSDESAPPEPASSASQSSEPTPAESPPPAPTSVAAAPPAPTSSAANSVAAGSSASPPSAPASTAAAPSHGQPPVKTRVARQSPPAPPSPPASHSAPVAMHRVEAAPQAPPASPPANNTAVPVQTPVAQVAQTQAPPPVPAPAPQAAIQPASTPVAASTASVSSTPPDGFWHAAESGDLAIVRGVISTNADVNALDPKGRRALILAIDHGQVTVVRELLAHGANPKLADAHGVTPQIAAHARGNFEITTALERANHH